MTELDPLDFFTTLTATAGVSLVVFVKPGCGACRAMRAAVVEFERRDPAVAVFMVDGEAGPGLVVDYEVFHFPALFVWRDGEYHAAVDAAPTHPALERALAEALARPPEPEP